jgi:hypothetical protein
MNEFTKYEQQYILILARNAKQHLEQQIQEGLPGWEFMGPDMPEYIKTLESIAKKAGENMKELDKKEQKA